MAFCFFGWIIAFLPCLAHLVPAGLPAAGLACSPEGFLSASRPVPGLVAVSPCANARVGLAAISAIAKIMGSVFIVALLREVAASNEATSSARIKFHWLAGRAAREAGGGTWANRD